MSAPTTPLEIVRILVITQKKTVQVPKDQDEDAAVESILQQEEEKEETMTLLEDPSWKTEEVEIEMVDLAHNLTETH